MRGPVKNFDEQWKQDAKAKQYIMLKKDNKLICRTQCYNSPIQLPPDLNILNMVGKLKVNFVSGLPSFELCPACQCSRDKKEWMTFLGYLRKYNKVAVVPFKGYEYYILPPDEGSNLSSVIVVFQMNKSHDEHQEAVEEKCIVSTAPIVPKENTKTTKSQRVMQKKIISTSACLMSPVGNVSRPSVDLVKDKEFDEKTDMYAREGGSFSGQDECSPNHILPHATPFNDRDVKAETHGKSQARGEKQNSLQKNFVCVDPSYLKTLGQAHSGWIFGALAELVDNSKDAKSTRLDISIDSIYYAKACKEVPMLSVVDDGHGMAHEDILKMLSFGHKRHDKDELERIGRFGIGFKTGVMRLGKDALVLTQTVNSRSIAFLSQSFNDGKENLEIPIVSYHRRGHIMELNIDIQSEALAKCNLKAIKDWSPFNKYLIGEKAGLFSENGTGTQIYVWNLDEWGSNYSLEWKNGTNGASSFHQGDILVRSRRSRSRPGQISQKVPLDYSLRAYLQVIFLEPRMKIYLQGALVKSCPLAKSLKNTVVENGSVMKTEVQLTLGYSQLEWERANGGLFLYWHGRLIEAYKRVGGMIHNAAVGRGLIGVADVTDLMNDTNGHVWVHNNKQGFQDCEPYALLEDWLGHKVDEYWDNNGDKLQVKKGKGLYRPDNEWVQCDKCRKWRMLTSGFDTGTIPQQCCICYCYMTPFDGSCEIPEQKVERGVITVSTKRLGYDLKQSPPSYETVPLLKACNAAGGSGDHGSSKTMEDGVTPSTRKRDNVLCVSVVNNREPTPCKKLRSALTGVGKKS